MNPDILDDMSDDASPVVLFPGVAGVIDIETAGLAVYGPVFDFSDGISDDLATVANFVAAHGIGGLGSALMPLPYVVTTLGAAIGVAYIAGLLLDAVGIKGPLALAAAGIIGPMALEVWQKRDTKRANG